MSDITTPAADADLILVDMADTISLKDFALRALARATADLDEVMETGGDASEILDLRTAAKELARTAGATDAEIEAAATPA
ncbi:Uncharacterised protein [Mycobacteroides abscessus subsp. abscessus]|nr:Uncharacterised protein [Mycobacteroides abscessus subsp. abscessus]